MPQRQPVSLGPGTHSGEGHGTAPLPCALAAVPPGRGHRGDGRSCVSLTLSVLVILPEDVAFMDESRAMGDCPVKWTWRQEC